MKWLKRTMDSFLLFFKNIHFIQIFSWYRKVEPFGHLQVKFHCCGSSFHLEQKCYTYAPSNVKVTKLLISFLTIICLYAWLTAMMHWLSNILNYSHWNIVSFLDKHLRQAGHKYWRWYPASLATDKGIRDMLNGRHNQPWLAIPLNLCH